MQILRLAARAIVPQAVRRDLYQVYHTQHVRRLPDRRYLETRIVPWLADRAIGGDVLFVGCRAYTQHYPGLFAQFGMTLWTADIDPEAAAFGAPGRHHVADLCALRAADFPVSFSAVFANGVIGWGIDDPEDIGEALVALRDLTPKGAPLVIGWNDDRSIDPMERPEAAVMFRPSAGPDGDSRMTFPDVTHVYDFMT